MSEDLVLLVGGGAYQYEGASTHFLKTIWNFLKKMVVESTTNNSPPFNYEIEETDTKGPVALDDEFHVVRNSCNTQLIWQENVAIHTWWQKSDLTTCDCRQVRAVPKNNNIFKSSKLSNFPLISQLNLMLCYLFLLTFWIYYYFLLMKREQKKKPFFT